MQGFLTIEEVMKRYSCCRKTIMKMVGDSRFPRPIMFAGRYFWHRSVLKDYDKRRIAESKKHARA